MVLKTGEGISGIAEESPEVNGSLPSWQAVASQPCRRAVTHGLPRALPYCRLTLAFLGCL